MGRSDSFKYYTDLETGSDWKVGLEVLEQADLMHLTTDNPVSRLQGQVV